MDIKEVYERAVEKWKWAVRNNGKINTIDCAYCELFDYNYCVGCPLNVSGVSCLKEGHPFCNWTEDECPEAAQAVLDLIIATKPF